MTNPTQTPEEALRLHRVGGVRSGALYPQGVPLTKLQIEQRFDGSAPELTVETADRGAIGLLSQVCGVYVGVC